MRIAYLCADRGVPVGGTKGASIHVESVVRALRRRGHEVPVLAARIDAAPEGGEAVEIGFDRSAKQVKKTLAGLGSGEQLAREVHALLLNGRTQEALAELDARRPLDALYERYSLWSWAGLRFARERGIPLVLEVNAPLVREQRRYRKLELGDVARALELELLRGADAVVVPSSELRGFVRETAGRDRRVLVLPNAVDERLFARPQETPAAAAAIPANRFVLAFVGSLKPWHGIPFLLRAFRRVLERVHDAHLLVVGDGPLRAAVEEAASGFGRGRITSAGAVPHREVPAWLARAHVGLAPYPPLKDFYFSPLKVVEYQAAGLPVVASGIGQLEELVEEGRTGLLVRPGREEELARAVALLRRDAGLRRKMGERGRQRVLRQGTWEGVAERIEEVLERLSERGRRAERAAGGRRA